MNKKEVITLVKEEKGTPIFSPATGVMTGEIQTTLVDEAKAILIQAGVDPTAAAECSTMLVDWAFCVVIGVVPKGALNSEFLTSPLFDVSTGDSL